MSEERRAASLSGLGSNILESNDVELLVTHLLSPIMALHGLYWLLSTHMCDCNSCHFAC